MAPAHLLALLLPLTAALGQRCDFTAAPGALSLLAARDAARSAVLSASPRRRLPADLNICVQGLHLVSRDAPFTLGPEDSVDPAGAGRVAWRGEPGAAVSGGVQVTGWALGTLAGAPAYVAPLPPAYPAGLPVRALWVGGVRAARTSTPNATLGEFKRWASHDNQTVGFTVSKPLPAAWANSTTAIEFSWPIVIANWIQPRCTIASVDFENSNITLASPCGAYADAREAHRKIYLPPPVNIEAALLPLAPGVFWHDLEGARLFYALRPGETETDLEGGAFVPSADVLLQLTNTSGHTFTGITFSYAGWWQVNTGAGFVDAQTAVYNNGKEPPGAVRCSGVSGVSFVNCTFARISSPYALEIANSSSDSGASFSSFSDLSGGAVKLGGVGGNAFSSVPSAWDARLWLSDSAIENTSLEYEGAAGVFAGYVQSTTIAHNAISDASYSAISVGWGWGSAFPPGFGNNSVTGKRIERVMRRLRDGGGVYVNGAEDGKNESQGWVSSMRGNFVNMSEAVYAVFCAFGLSFARV